MKILNVYIEYENPGYIKTIKCLIGMNSNVYIGRTNNYIEGLTNDWSSKFIKKINSLSAVDCL